MCPFIQLADSSTSPYLSAGHLLHLRLTADQQLATASNGWRRRRRRLLLLQRTAAHLTDERRFGACIGRHWPPRLPIAQQDIRPLGIQPLLLLWILRRQLRRLRRRPQARLLLNDAIHRRQRTDAQHRLGAVRALGAAVEVAVVLRLRPRPAIVAGMVVLVLVLVLVVAVVLVVELLLLLVVVLVDVVDAGLRRLRHVMVMVGVPVEERTELSVGGGGVRGLVHGVLLCHKTSYNYSLDINKMLTLKMQ